MDLPRIKAYLESNNFPAYRLRQIQQNYFSARFKNFAQMSDLPLTLRTELEKISSLYSVSSSKLLSGENSQKSVLQLHDGLQIETVVMDYGQWLTACISTQVGCPLACTFCATGKMGLKRNLSVDEIVDQILFWNNTLAPKYIGRVVFMGMGEPFLNWDNLGAALKIINTDIGIGARKMSISTAGVAPRIIDFANMNTQINLAVSLHSADQDTREQMMPIARQYKLPELKAALDYYTAKTNRQVFFEYLLAKNINDSDYHLEMLIDFIKSNQLYYLNLIPLNPIKGGLIPSPRLDKFSSTLSDRNINFSVRQSIGRSIDSACGQLIVENKV